MAEDESRSLGQTRYRKRIAGTPTGRRKGSEFDVNVLDIQILISLSYAAWVCVRQAVGRYDG